MVRSHARVRTVKAARYFKALSRHFAIKVRVEQEEDQARIHFPTGLCVMTVDGETLDFDCKADDPVALEQVQWIIDSHLTKFGEFRESTIQWFEAD